MTEYRLIKIGCKLVNLDHFSAFEFDDDKLCLWAYYCNTVTINNSPAYTGFVCDTQHEYDNLKQHLNTLVYAGDTIVERKPPAPPTAITSKKKTPFKVLTPTATTTRPPLRKYGK